MTTTPLLDALHGARIEGTRVVVGTTTEVIHDILGTTLSLITVIGAGYTDADENTTGSLASMRDGIKASALGGIGLLVGIAAQLAKEARPEGARE